MFMQVREAVKMNNVDGCGCSRWISKNQKVLEANRANAVCCGSSHQTKLSKKLKSKLKRRERSAAKKNSEKLVFTKGQRFNRSSKGRKIRGMWNSLKQPHFGQVSSNWYWANYRKALNWRDRYEIDKWKARAHALEEQNRYFVEVIRSLQSDHRNREISTPTVTERLQRDQSNNEYSASGCKLVHPLRNVPDDYKEEENSDEYVTGEDNEDIEFELSEEMIKFFEESFKHKMNLKKEKEEMEEKIEIDKQVEELQKNKLKRISEMNSLYGDDAPKITGMETAVQLSFNKYCDTKCPKYWPNIPLNL